MDNLQPQCPQCGTDFTEARKVLDDESLAFCLKCKFPLVVVANKYRLESVLGKGGFGTVYLAHHVHLVQDAQRVIKIMKPEIFEVPGMKERFFREVQVTSVLSQRDEHIVRIYDDFGDIPHVGHYYVMEYLQGTSLKDVLKEPENPPSLSFCLHIFRQLCEAMQEAHDSDVVHRDLKPDNIHLIERKGERHFLKIIDFGIARPINQTELENTSLTRGALGTPFYMSPEQCTNKPVDGRADLYSMGIILYELLTGYTPFRPRGSKKEDLSLVQILGAQLSQKPPSPREIRPDRVPPALEQVLYRALAKDPDERYPSALALLQAVESSFPPIQVGVEASRPAETASYRPSDKSPPFDPETSSGSEDLSDEEMAEQDTMLLADKEEASSPKGISSRTPKKEVSPLPEGKEVASAGEEGRPQEKGGISQVSSELSSAEMSLPPSSGRLSRLLLLVGVVVLVAGGGVLWTLLKEERKGDPSLHKGAEGRVGTEGGLAQGGERSGERTSLAQGGREPSMGRPLSTEPRPRKDLSPSATPDDGGGRGRRPQEGAAGKESPLPDSGALARKEPARRRPVKRRGGREPRRRRPSLRRRVVSRYPVRGCPAARRGRRWVRLRLQPRGVYYRLSFLHAPGSSQRRGSWLCVGIRPKTSFRLSAPGYQPCTLSLPFRHGRYRLQMKKESLDDIETSRDYCLPGR